MKGWKKVAAMLRWDTRTQPLPPKGKVLITHFKTQKKCENIPAHMKNTNLPVVPAVKQITLARPWKGWAKIMLVAPAMISLGRVIIKLCYETYTVMMVCQGKRKQIRQLLPFGPLFSSGPLTWKIKIVSIMFTWDFKLQIIDVLFLDLSFTTFVCYSFVRLLWTTVRRTMPNPCYRVLISML